METDMFKNICIHIQAIQFSVKISESLGTNRQRTKKSLLYREFYLSRIFILRSIYNTTILN